MANGTEHQQIAAVRDGRIQSYVSTPADILEHFGLESQIAQDYRGRLVYELLQNADDALAGCREYDGKVLFRLTRAGLLVANNGRPVSEEDLRALCGLSVSSHTTKKAQDRRRATIGQKGMGFKSVLEVTDTPQVYSTGLSFVFDRERSADALRAVPSLGSADPAKVPIMRLPFTADSPCEPVATALAAGHQTVFWFPFRTGGRDGLYDRMADLLGSLDTRSVLFLRHVDEVVISVEEQGQRHWLIQREAAGENFNWQQVPSSPDRGITRVTLIEDEQAAALSRFLVFVDRTLEIGENRYGLDVASWEGVELSEVGIAFRIGEADHVIPLRDDPRIHVFLPTEERCPFPFLVNGAFACNLSREAVEVSKRSDDYNRLLLRHAARLVADEFVPMAVATDHAASEILAVLDRASALNAAGEATTEESACAQSFVEDVRHALADVRFVPTGEPGRTVSVLETTVPPSPASAPHVGPALRQLIGEGRLAVGDRTRFLPHHDLCSPQSVRVLLDLGAVQLPVAALGALLERIAPGTPSVEGEHGVRRDPVLDVVVDLWHASGHSARMELVAAVSRASVLPVGQSRPDGTLKRVGLRDGTTCFYPLRGVLPEVPLPGVVFLSHEVCWGRLTPKDRNEYLRRELEAWHAIWGIEEFRFDAVMRTAILPRLTLDAGGDSVGELHDIAVLAAICQLSSRRAKAGQSLVHERLGTQRNLFRLCRLPVPCAAADGTVTWVPAYRAYLGSDWLGEISAQRLFDLLPDGHPDREHHYVIGPSLLRPYLEKYHFLRDAASEEGDIEEETAITDEADEDEDEDVPIDAPEDERWRHFLGWIGVNSHLRPIPLLDAEDEGSWTSTGDLLRPQARGALSRLNDTGWNEFKQAILDGAAKHAVVPENRLYLYRVYDLEALPGILDQIRQAPASDLAKELFRHLCCHWSALSVLAELHVAAPKAKWPNQRTKPPRAYDDEVFSVGDSPWFWLLLREAWCPTTQGPRCPNQCWMPMPEVLRRFQPFRSRDEILLPTIDPLTAEAARNRPRFPSTLGIRTDLNPSTFEVRDCLAVLERLRDLYGDGENLAEGTALRDVVNPTYRHLVELMPPVREERATAQTRKWSEASDRLACAPLLCHNGDGQYRFQQARDTLHASRRDTRQRIGFGPDLWTFVLEGHPAATAPLREFLQVQILEDVIHGTPQISPTDLPESEVARIVAGVREVAPFLLCRLEADRAAERLMQQDASNLRRVLDGLEIVGACRVDYSLPGVEGARQSTREYFWQEARTDMPAHLYVRWGERIWPPDDDAAEALAAGICEALNVTAFEPLFALIQAPGEAARHRLLVRASAPCDDERLADKRRRLSGEDSAKPGGEASTTTVLPQLAPAAPPGDSGAVTRRIDDNSAAPEVAKHPLWNPNELRFEGEAIVIAGDIPVHTPTGPAGGGQQHGHPGSGGRAASRTDLSELDRVGMALALRYELSRVGQGGPGVAVFDADDSSTFAKATVFDVSSPDKIAVARVANPRLEAVMTLLASPEAFSLSAEYPGFDILTLKPDTPGPASLDWIDRMIELKSSGVHARVQEMTWNEWKTAKDSRLARRFWLYLIGNLRSDLNGATPFLQMVNDPMRRIRAVPIESRSIQRKIQVYTAHFAEAELIEMRIGHGAS